MIALNNNNNNNSYYYYYCNIEDVIKMYELLEISCYLPVHLILASFVVHHIASASVSTQRFVFPKDPPTFLCRGFCPPDPLGAGFNVDWNRVSVSEILESLDNPIQVMRIIVSLCHCSYISDDCFFLTTV